MIFVCGLYTRIETAVNGGAGRRQWRAGRICACSNKSHCHSPPPILSYRCPATVPSSRPLPSPRTPARSAPVADVLDDNTPRRRPMPAFDPVRDAVRSSPTEPFQSPAPPRRATNLAVLLNDSAAARAPDALSSSPLFTPGPASAHATYPFPSPADDGPRPGSSSARVSALLNPIDDHPPSRPGTSGSSAVSSPASRSPVINNLLRPSTPPAPEPASAPTPGPRPRFSAQRVPSDPATAPAPLAVYRGSGSAAPSLSLPGGLSFPMPSGVAIGANPLDGPSFAPMGTATEKRPRGGMMAASPSEQGPLSNLALPGVSYTPVAIQQKTFAPKPRQPRQLPAKIRQKQEAQKMQQQMEMQQQLQQQQQQSQQQQQQPMQQVHPIAPQVERTQSMPQPGPAQARRPDAPAASARAGPDGSRPSPLPIPPVATFPSPSLRDAELPPLAHPASHPQPAARPEPVTSVPTAPPPFGLSLPRSGSEPGVSPTPTSQASTWPSASSPTATAPATATAPSSTASPTSTSAPHQRQPAHQHPQVPPPPSRPQTLDGHTARSPMPQAIDPPPSRAHPAHVRPPPQQASGSGSTSHPSLPPKPDPPPPARASSSAPHQTSPPGASRTRGAPAGHTRRGAPYAPTHRRTPAASLLLPLTPAEADMYADWMARGGLGARVLKTRTREKAQQQQQQQQQNQPNQQHRELQGEGFLIGFLCLYGWGADV
jgi:hypothetical protein